VVPQENKLRVMVHTLPSGLGYAEPAGKRFAVGLAMLAAQARLSWLCHMSKAADRTSTLSAREPDTAVSERLLGQTLKEVLLPRVGGRLPEPGLRLASGPFIRHCGADRRA